LGFEVVTLADYYGGTDEKEEAGGNKYFCTKGDEIGSGGKTSYPVIYDTDERIRPHEASFCERAMVLSRSGTVRPDVARFFLILKMTLTITLER
jgi:hypothetical protein